MRVSLEVDVPVVGEDMVRGYVLRGLVEHVAEAEGWVAIVRVGDGDRWYRCADRETCEVERPKFAMPMLVVYERRVLGAGSSVDRSGTPSAPTDASNTGSPTSSQPEPGSMPRWEEPAAHSAPAPLSSSDLPSFFLSDPLPPEADSHTPLQADLGPPPFGVEAAGYGVLPVPLSADPIPSSGAPVPVGLKNVGNTCYLNSLLQCILVCDDLRFRFLDGTNEDSPLFNAIQSVVSRMDVGRPVPVDLLGVLRDATLSLMVRSGYKGVQVRHRSGRDEGYAVYMASLSVEDVFTVIADECCKETVLARTAIERTCQRCGYVRLFVEMPVEVEVLELPIPATSGRSISDLLQQVREGELIRPQETCRFWDPRRRAWRPQLSRDRTYFLAAPKVLALSVPQAVGTERVPRLAGRQVKLDDAVSISTIHSDRLVWYELRGVVVPKPGHWVAYVRRSTIGPWYLCDDDKPVVRVDHLEQLACSMVFYVQVDHAGYAVVSQPLEAGAVASSDVAEGWTPCVRSYLRTCLCHCRCGPIGLRTRRWVWLILGICPI